MLLVKWRFEWRMNEGYRSSTKNLDRFAKLGNANGDVLPRGFPDRIHQMLSGSRPFQYFVFSSVKTFFTLKGRRDSWQQSNSDSRDEFFKLKTESSETLHYPRLTLSSLFYSLTVEIGSKLFQKYPTDSWYHILI